jgi:methylthioxylose transferase
MTRQNHPPTRWPTAQVVHHARRAYVRLMISEARHRPSQRFSGSILAAAAFATVAFSVGFHFRWFPLGVPGELEWPRLGNWDVPIASWLAMLPALVVAVALAVFVYRAQSWIESARRRTFVVTLLCSIVLGALFQLFLEIAAPYSLQKWAVLHHGFRAAARLKFDDVPSVLQNHTQVIEELEPNHVSANPAGWIVLYRALLSFFDNHPVAAKMIWKIEPHEIAWSLRQNYGSTALADQAAIALMALINRLAAVAVGLPIAWLAHQRFGRAAALAACAMANLVPAAILLAPAADTVYATFAALIVALSHFASVRTSWPAAGAAGVLIGVGMLFSLCYLVVAALCALMVLLQAFAGRRPTMASAAAAVFGWLAPLLLMALLFGHYTWESWCVNLAKNHEFNAYCGCTYRAWVGVNLLELAVAMGIPVTVFVVGRFSTLPAGQVRGEGIEGRQPNANTLAKGDKAALVAAWLSMIVLLDLSGTNRGEVSRLWLFLMPIGAALAVEWIDMASRRGRAIVALLLLLQAFNCTLLARELVLLWPSAPRQIQEQYLRTPGGKWASYRRLSDSEIQRRRGPQVSAPSAEH